MIRDLTQGSVPKQLVRFALPLFFSGLLQTVYNMVDMIIVGQYVGKTGLSAVSVGGEVLTMLTFIAMGMSNAGQIIISQYVGSRQYDKIQKMVGTLFTFLLSCSIMMTVVCLIIRKNILHWINMPSEAMADGEAYILVCICGLFFIYGYNLVSAILRGMGDSKHPFWFIAVASVVNLVLDILFVAILKSGTLGAALATVIGQAVSFLWSLIYLYRHKEQFGFDFKLKSFGIYKEVFFPLIKLGIPMMLQSAAITFSKLFITSWVNTYGVVASAVTGVGNKLQVLTNVFAQALSAAGGSMIAQNIGAEKYERVPKVVKTSFVIDAVVAIVLSVLTVLYPRVVFGIFTSDAEVLDMANSYLPIAVLLYAGCVFRPPMMALINGSGNSKLNIAIALLDGIAVRIGLAYLLGAICNMGIHGFWYGNAISGFVPFLIGFPYYLSGKWRTRKYLLQKKEQQTV